MQKETLKATGIILLLIIMFISIYLQDIEKLHKKQLEENRIKNMEINLQKQMNYIHELEAKVNNIERRIER